MTQRQRDILTTMMVNSPLDLGGDVAEQRVILHELLTRHPRPDDVSVSPVTLGGVPALAIEIDGQEAEGTILWFHGGVFALGSAEASVDLASDLGRRSHMRVVTLDYRLAPEHPYPAGPQDAFAAYRGLLEEGVDPSRVVVAGESAGGNLAMGILVTIRDTGLPMPSAGLLMSPWVDLAGTGTSLTTKAAIDPALTPDGLRVRARGYLGDVDPASATVSPIHADLSGLPPLLIQVGSHEILLDDATRLANRAASDDVSVILDVVAGVPHVFQAFAGLIDEGDRAMDRAAEFVRAQLDVGSRPIAQ